MIEAKDAENAVLRAELEAQRDRYRLLELRVAELERRLGSDSTTSGTPPSKDPIGAQEQRKAERARQDSRPSGSAARTAGAVASRASHNRHRDWHDGNHPGYALGCWLRDYKEQVCQGLCVCLESPAISAYLSR